MMRFSDHRWFSWIAGIAFLALSGLAAPASAQVAGGDDDGDGVPNASDNCPNLDTNSSDTLTDPVTPDEAIPDGPVACNAPGTLLVRTINVPAGDNIVVDLDVVLDIAHSWYGDVRVTLEHGGTTVVLLLQQDPDDNSDLGGVYTIDDEAASTLDDAAVSVPAGTLIPLGSYQSEELLSAFDGQDPQGIWTLTISDWCQLDTGTLQSWSLDFIVSDQADTDLDGVGDACDIVGCVGVGTPCNDGLFCTLTDTCQGGICVGTGSPCSGPDGDANCAESCNEAADNCTLADPNGAACNDGLFCTLTDTCTTGVCGGAGNTCPGPDGDSDCSETCNEAADNCSTNDTDGSACDDGSACNGADTCLAGTCSQHALPPCASCDGQPNGTECDDGLFCTLTDTCQNNNCVGTGNPCLPLNTNNNDCSETCNEAADNCTANDPNGTGCDLDEQFCTDDACNGAGTCVAGGSPCPGQDGDGDCSESCNEAADNCTANDPDNDEDGVPEDCDNCPGDSNPGQADTDDDGEGDACDDCTDTDGDGFGNPGFPDNTCSDDNCPNRSNPSQSDQDGDGIGDACGQSDDSGSGGGGNEEEECDDDDLDGRCDDSDNCPDRANATQDDAEGDGVGDACDNCPEVSNADQADADNDGVGDDCESVIPPDLDTDGDGIKDVDDNCITVENSDQADADGDNVGDVCDNCADVANTNQADTDDNGIGDACQAPPDGIDDADSDGIEDSEDNCPTLNNPSQADSDDDGIGDLCEEAEEPDGLDCGEGLFPIFPIFPCGAMGMISLWMMLAGLAKMKLGLHSSRVRRRIVE